MADLAFQRLLLKAVLSTPDPILRLLSGGGVIYRGGRTLEPKFQFLWKAWRKPRLIEDVSPEEARLGWSALVRTCGFKPSAAVRTETLLLDGPGGPMTTRLYSPPDQDPGAPMLVFLHAGSGVVGDLDASDGFATQLAAISRAPVLAPDYRLAPEHRFPAGFEDALFAYRWARDNASRYGARGAAVGGESMGAGFAAAICQTLKQAGEPQPALQLLVCPILDAISDSQSMQTYADVWPMSVDTLKWIFGHYLGPEADPFDPRLSPFRAKDVSGLAPAIIVTAGFDPLVDQGELYARKLKAQGTPVVYRCYDALAHAFTGFAGVVPEAEVASVEIGGFLREGVIGRIAAASAGPDHAEQEKSLML
jgi:acetyl esterase/lipase